MVHSSSRFVSSEEAAFTELTSDTWIKVFRETFFLSLVDGLDFEMRLLR